VPKAKPHALPEEQKLQFVVYIICGHTIFSGINVIRYIICTRKYDKCGKTFQIQRAWMRDGVSAICTIKTSTCVSYQLLVGTQNNHQLVSQRSA